MHFSSIYFEAVNIQCEPIFNFSGIGLSPSRLQHGQNTNSMKWDSVLPGGSCSKNYSSKSADLINPKSPFPFDTLTA